MNKQPEKSKEQLAIESMLKTDTIILWIEHGYDGYDSVETGSVNSFDECGVHIRWLDEGYMSRNDTVPWNEVLAVYDKKGPQMHIFKFSEKGYITEAGEQWKLDHPKGNE